ncbi:MAG: outer membrane protein assembly factor BamE [Celeribacter marinus]
MYKRPDHISMTRLIRACVAVAAIAVLSACVAQTRNHGYVPSEAELDQVTVGTDTMQTVASAIGRPSAEGVLDATGWYYVRSQFQTLGAFAPKEIDRQVVAISFGANGVVSNVERFGLSDGRVVALSRRVTTANTRGVTFLQQLFGNLGRIDTSSLLQ